MKKLVLLLLAVALILASFSVVAEDSKYSEHYTIVWAGGHDTSAVKDDDPVLVKLNEMFNVTIKVDYMNRDELATEMMKRAQLDELPDIIYCPELTAMSYYVEQGMILPLTEELVAQNMPLCYEWMMKKDPMCFAMTSIDGTIYGLPRFTADGGYCSSPFWRKDWLAELGYADGEYPVTLEEFEEAFYAFVDPELDIANKCMQNVENKGKIKNYALSDLGFDPIYGAFGALPDRWIEEDGKIIFGAVYPGMKDALELLHKWYVDGVIDPEFTTTEATGVAWVASAPFMNETIGFSSSGYVYTLTPEMFNGEPREDKANRIEQNGRSFRAFANQYGYDNVITLGTNPIGPDGKQGNEVWNPLESAAICFSYKLADDPEKLARIMAIVDYLNGDWEGYLMQDKWDTALENYMEYPGRGWDKIDLEYERASGTENHGNMFNSLQNPYFKGQNMQYRYVWADNMPQFNTGGYRAGLIATTTPAWAENGVYLENLWKDTYVKIIKGTLDVDYFDTFVEEWLAAGGQDATDEAQAWYDSVK